MTTAPSSPPAATYPTGFAGYSRDWDGVAWTGAAKSDPSAPELHEQHAILRIFTHPSVYIAVVGVVLGFVVATSGVSLDSWPLLALGGALVAGGPLIALVVAVRRRLRVGHLRTGAALAVGIVWGAVACAAALVIEVLVERSGTLSTGALAFDGVIEEPLKLLLPVVLLAVGPAIFKNPRVGVWMVVVASAVFGIGEAALYIAGPAISPDLKGLTTAQFDTKLATETGQLLVQRMWVELAHVIWTGGAAALIWLGAHRAGRAFTWIGLLGFLIAVAQHVVNDAVLTLVDADLLHGVTIAGFIWVVLGYYLWFRPRVRQLVPPDAVAVVPKRWRPHLSREARQHAAAAGAAQPATTTAEGVSAAG
ncbi:PrsW family glutamic-type intramembrane protease [Herbiconiux sp. UC225_62]|uniref:PrsW family glutamic-type intramembrane protease n=1 Tax=Herbiconiux sp. UC225_62 TaxID=3350168 RepID=UPI0036D289F5